LFAEQIGPYPFADFQIVSAPLPVGLGFPGLTYIDRRILPLPFVKDRSLAHEVLHNWWGNGVMADDATGNWSEGLTTYMADHAMAAARDAGEAAEMRLGWLRDYAALPRERDMPVVQFRSKSHDASQVVGYGKVALIFQMLRDEIGDAAFAEALQRFWQMHQFQSAGWPDLQSAFETAAQRDLAWFFDQWTKRMGAPSLELVSAAAGNGAGAGRGSGASLSLTLRQSAPTYRLEVPVTIVTTNGTVHSRVRLDGQTETTQIDLDAMPISLRVDAENTLFRRLLPGEAPPIMRDVALDGTARTLVLYDDDSRTQ
jgi:aminopeptidase N